MTSRSPSKGEEAKRIVREKYPASTTIRGLFGTYVVWGMGKRLSENRMNEELAWLSAAERILKEGGKEE